jgi:hypothetical protein
MSSKEELEEDISYLALGQRWRDHLTENDGETADHLGAEQVPVAAAQIVTSAEKASEEKPEGFQLPAPILMFKVLATSEEMIPADLSFLSVYSAQNECVFAPGTFMNIFDKSSKVYTEHDDLPDGTCLAYKTAEVRLTPGRSLDVNVIKNRH